MRALRDVLIAAMGALAILLPATAALAAQDYTHAVRSCAGAQGSLIGGEMAEYAGLSEGDRVAVVIATRAEMGTGTRAGTTAEVTDPHASLLAGSDVQDATRPESVADLDDPLTDGDDDAGARPEAEADAKLGVPSMSVRIGVLLGALLVTVIALLRKKIKGDEPVG